MKTALTAEEWEHKEFAMGEQSTKDTPGHMLFGYVDDSGFLHLGWDGGAMHPVKNPAGLAALSLYGQPLGFTRKDVTAIQNGISGISSTHQQMCASNCPCEAEITALNSLAGRIESLLSPEEK